MDTTQKITSIEINENSRKEVTDTVVREYSFRLLLNGKELVTLLCLPTKLEHLIAGYLFTQRLINSRDDIIKLKLDEEKGKAEVTTVITTIDSSKSPKLIDAREVRNYSGAGDNITPIQSKLTVPAGRIFNLVDEFIDKSDLFKNTGGVHSAAVCSIDGFVAYSDDIGRHNAVDKVIGECVMNDISRGDKILLTSGRISSEILLKVARAGIPVAISKSAVTDGAVKHAERLGITLIGFVRGHKMSVYTNSRRIMIE